MIKQSFSENQLACFFWFKQYFNAPEGHRLICLMILWVSVPSKFIQGITEVLKTSDNSLAHFSA